MHFFMNRNVAKRLIKEMDQQKKKELHPRNIHNQRYDFPNLISTCPDLKPFIAENKFGNLSLDFADPNAVKMLNKALLQHFYQLEKWDIPPGYLCPPIPGRADYIHYIADLLAESNGGNIPKGKKIRGLDIGVGANCIYPILGNRIYHWFFIGTDVDPVSIKDAKIMVD